MQLYKVNGANFANAEQVKTKLVKVKPDEEKGRTLADIACDDPKLATKRAEVEDRLQQYLSLYNDEVFTVQTLKKYLYDDIFRLRLSLKEKDPLTPQALLTTEQGLKRLAGRSKYKENFPADGQVKFYRTLSFGKFAQMLGIATAGLDSAALETHFPREGVNLKSQIRDTSALGHHAGDYKQAISYLGNANEAQVLLEFNFDAGKFFKKENLALPDAGVDDLRSVLVAKFGDGYAKASTDQGTNATLPGIKSENRGVYSVGLSDQAMGKFIGDAGSIKVMEYHIP